MLRERRVLKVLSYLAWLWGFDAGDGVIKGQAPASVVEKYGFKCVSVCLAMRTGAMSSLLPKRSI